MPRLEPFVRPGNLVEGQHLVYERAHLPAFYQASHLIEPRPLSQKQHTVERLVETVAWGEIPLQGNDTREPTKDARRLDAPGYKVSAGGIEDRIDPLPGGVVQRNFEDVLRGVIYGHIGPKLLQGILVMSPGARQNPRPGSPGYLYGEGPNPTRSAVDQDRLPHTHGEPPDDRLVGCAPGEGHGCGLLVRERGGLLRHDVRPGYVILGVRSVGPRPED